MMQGKCPSWLSASTRSETRSSGAREYSEAWGMTENWAYLVGTEDELGPVWESYYVVAAVDEQARVADVPEEWKVDRVRGVDALRRGYRLAVYGDAPCAGLSHRQTG